MYFRGDKMFKIGLTGGIGTGKSTVAGMLMEKGMPIIDADKISREVIYIYPEIKNKIKNTFGPEFFDEEDNFIRRKFGDFIFKNQEIRKQYESIIIPYIKKAIFRQIKVCEDMDEEACVLDAPTLIENGLHNEMDVNILVFVDRKIQIKRVMERDNMDEQNVINRINSQMSLEEKRKYVDFVIDTGINLEYTAKQVDKIMDSIKILGDCK